MTSSAETQRDSRQKGLFAPEKLLDYATYITAETVSPPYHTTENGVLFDDDCMKVLPAVKDHVIDTVFADPPFNLGKEYGRRSNDLRPDSEYVRWCQEWLGECVRVLKPGGSLFVYNLPKWNLLLGAYLVEVGLQFRHWIAIEISSSLPIPGRLHPSHYGLLYFSKGKPKTFRRIRTPIETCRHCGGEIKDYGGYRNKMNPNGVTLKDVWSDIPPVRHRKFKSQDRKANTLSTKLVSRCVEMSTEPGDMVLDPFGGGGTTFAVCERRDRKWIGIEIDFCSQIVDRLQNDEIKEHRCGDFVEV